MTRVLPHFALPHLTDEAVAAYADGVLSSGPQGRAQQHLVECVECAAAVRDQRATRFMLRASVAPAVPGSLLERLRQLPTTEPMRGLPLAAMTVDGQPSFAAYGTQQRVETTESVAAAVPSAPVLKAAPIGPSAVRRHLPVPVLGVSAAALIVGVLAGTASTAGGTAARPAGPAVNSVQSVTAANSDRNDDLSAVTSVPAFNVVGTP